MEGLRDRVALVTGASRGVGAATARLLAERGADVIITYREKRRRADEVALEVERVGRRALLVQADITQEAEVRRLGKAVADAFSSLDILILNASGGLEKDKPTDYPMTINRDAQMWLVEHLSPLMPSGGVIVFVTSHWAHFYGQKPVHGIYEPVAESKKAGENALLAQVPDLDRLGIRLAIVSGDLIEGTITPRLLERDQAGLLDARRAQIGHLTTVEEFAESIVNAASEPSMTSGEVIFVGPTDW